MTIKHPRMDEKARIWFDDKDNHDNDLDSEKIEEVVWQERGTKTEKANEPAHAVSSQREMQKPKPVKSKAPHAKHSSRNLEGMPRRPLSAYNFFFKEQRDMLVREREQGQQIIANTNTSDMPTTPDTSKVGFESMAKTIGFRWKRIGAEELKRYKALAEEDSKRYRTEMDEYLWRAAEAARTRQEQPRPSSLPLSNRIGSASGIADSDAVGMMSTGSILSTLASPPVASSTTPNSGSNQPQHPAKRGRTSNDRSQNRTERLQFLTAHASPNTFMQSNQGGKPCAREVRLDHPARWPGNFFNSGSISSVNRGPNQNEDAAGMSRRGDFAHGAVDSERKRLDHPHHSKNSPLEHFDETMYLETSADSPRLQENSNFVKEAQDFFPIDRCGAASMGAITPLQQSGATAPLQQSGENALVRLIDSFSSVETEMMKDSASLMQLLEPQPIAPGATAAESLSLLSQQAASSQNNTYQQNSQNDFGVTRYQPNLDGADDWRDFASWFANM